MMVPGWAIYAVGVGVLMLIGLVLELRRRANDAEDVIARLALNGLAHRGKAEQAEAHAQELDCRLRHVLELHENAVDAVSPN